jgi:3-oxoacyl-[acyl-carrier protein] reductase
MQGLLVGSTAIITGAGRGIGAATARLFAEHGARLVLSDLDGRPLEETASAIRGADGQVVTVVGDVTAPDFAETVLRASQAAFGLPDIVVNNAGYTWDGVIQKMSDAQWEAMLAIHLTAPFRLLRALAEPWREAAKQEAQGGQARARKVVNVSSTSGTRGNSGQVNYAAGKAGIVGVTTTLAKEWGRFNIQVNAVAFGMIETRLTQAREQGEAIEREGANIALGIPDNMRQLGQMMIPMGRAGTPEEAAGPILFLASPLANYVSGQVLEVTGGL